MIKYRGQKKLSHTVMVPSEKLVAGCRWCVAQFGNRFSITDTASDEFSPGMPAGVWQCVWAGPGDPHRYEFRFDHETDAVLFALRWS